MTFSTKNYYRDVVGKHLDHVARARREILSERMRRSLEVLDDAKHVREKRKYPTISIASRAGVPRG